MHDAPMLEQLPQRKIFEPNGNCSLMLTCTLTETDDVSPCAAAETKAFSCLLPLRRSPRCCFEAADRLIFTTGEAARGSLPSRLASRPTDLHVGAARGPKVAANGVENRAEWVPATRERADMVQWRGKSQQINAVDGSQVAADQGRGGRAAR